MKPKILVIDDDIPTATNIAKRLQLKGYETVSLQDGRECLSHLEKDHYDLVLLDIVMPEISGMEVLKQIRQKYKPTELPVIMLTFMDENDLVVEALSDGANDYILKPIHIEIVEARIKSQLRVNQLTQESIRKKELEVLSAMVVTYNHEINTPLAVAYCALNRIEKNYGGSPKDIERTQKALDRIKDIVKDIEGITKKASVPYDTYSGGTKMVKIS